MIWVDMLSMVQYGGGSTVGYGAGRIGDMYVSNADFVKVGDRVELHPATDRWMMGDRFGVVIHLHERSQTVTVKLDRSGLNRAFSARNIGSVVYD